MASVAVEVPVVAVVVEFQRMVCRWEKRQNAAFPEEALAKAEAFVPPVLESYRTFFPISEESWEKMVLP
jgi:hypothetical protein